MIRVSGRTVNNIVQRVKNAGWTVAVQVSQDAEDQDGESATPVQGQRSREEILRLLIREALHCSAHGLADDFYIQSVASMWETSMSPRNSSVWSNSVAQSS